MTLKLAIWDLDGTIIDSREIIQTAMERAFEACGHRPPRYEETRHTIGIGLVEAMAELAPDLDPRDHAALGEAYRSAFLALRTEGRGFEPLYPGAAETVKRLAEAGWLLGIATGKARRGVDAFFEQHGLQPYFDTAWCADDGPGKPSPFMVQAGMDALGVDAAATVMIGDAVHDMRMGRSAGVRTVGVSWGFGEAHELEAAGAHDLHHEYETLNAALDAFFDAAADVDD